MRYQKTYRRYMFYFLKYLVEWREFRTIQKLNPERFWPENSMPIVGIVEVKLVIHKIITRFTFGCFLYWFSC